MSNEAEDSIGDQVLESVEADFDEMTWTFRLQSHNRVSGGHFVILPVLPYSKAMAKLAYAEQILRGLCDTETAHSIGAKNIESIHKFFDPEPLG